MLGTLRKLGTAVLVLMTTGTLLSAVLSLSTTSNTTTTASPVTRATDQDCFLSNSTCPLQHFLVNDCGVSTTLTTTPEPGTADNTTARAPESRCRKCDKSCSSCNGTSQYDCINCFDGWEKDNGTCKSQSGLPIEAKIGIGVGAGVGGLVIIIVIVVLSVRHCRRRSHFSEPHGIEELSESRGSSLERESKLGQKQTQGETRLGKKTKVEEATYANVQSQSVRTSSIEHGHDKMFRYVKDPTLKKVKADPESEELNSLPEAPPPPVVPDQQEYEIQDHSSKDKISQKTALKPKVKAKPAAKPNQTRRHQTTTLKQEDATGLVDSKSMSTSLPMFPIEELELNREEMKKKEEIEKKTKKAEAERQKAEERRKKNNGAATAAGKKGRPQPGKNATTPNPQPPPSDNEDDNLPDYENEGTVTQMRQKAVNNQTAQTNGGVDNPTMADEPLEEYGNQAAVEEAARQHHGNSTPGEIYMPMDGMGGALGGVDDEPTDVYENKLKMGPDEPHEVYENSHEEGDKSVYQNVNFPANTRSR